MDIKTEGTPLFEKANDSVSVPVVDEEADN
jgi:hypothetical protein